MLDVDFPMRFHFNPRARKERDRARATLVQDAKIISIHAPVKSATSLG